MLLLISCPPVREVFPNYEVVMFQPRTGTPTDLGSITNFYRAILLIPVPPFSVCHPMSAQGGYPLMPLPSLPLQPFCLHTGSFTHLVVTFLRPRIPRPISPCIRLYYLPASPSLATLS